MALEQEIGTILAERGLTLAVAESCTGGLVGHRITSVAGASRYFLGGILAYADAVKVACLGVESALLEQEGAVSADVAEAMAVGVRRALGADIGAAVTGIAGPGGGSPEKPVGLVFLAVCDGEEGQVRRQQFAGDREEIRRQAATEALKLVNDYLKR